MVESLHVFNPLTLFARDLTLNLPEHSQYLFIVKRLKIRRRLIIRICDCLYSGCGESLELAVVHKVNLQGVVEEIRRRGIEVQIFK
jgi:hypothetical protein